MRNSTRLLLRRKSYLLRKCIRILKLKAKIKYKLLCDRKYRQRIHDNNLSGLLGFLKRKSFTIEQGISFKDETAILNIPEIFSFTENPNETIKVLKMLFSLGCNQQVRKIFFDHSKCRTLGIGASTVMDIIVMNIEKYRKKNGRLELGGKNPKDADNVNEILHVSGLLKHLKVTKNITLPPTIKILDLVSGGRSCKNFRIDQSDSGRTDTLVTEYFNECLMTQGIELSDEGKYYVSQMVGEVINNCELHCGEFCQWHALGHYSINQEGKYGECHLVIFNYGQTIYEGLKSFETSTDVKKELESMSNIHTRKGFFSFSKWDEETLWTLYALQDGISRCFDREKDPDRGTGTIKFIQSFQEIGDTAKGKKAKMSIISGNTFIYFDYKYKLQDKELPNGNVIQVIAFNERNDLEEPPDPTYVKKLDHYFPGTIISMKFYLDRKVLKKVMEESKNGDRAR